MDNAHRTIDFVFHYFIYACALAGAGWFAYWLYAFSTFSNPLHDTGIRIIIAVAVAGGAIGAALRRND